MKFNCGDQVYWEIPVGGVNIERAGVVVAVVPAGADPYEYTPEGMFCKLNGSIREDESYLIRVPGISYVFWPRVGKLSALTTEKAYILDTQPKVTKHYIIKTVDHSDRLSILAIAMLMEDEVVQTKDLIEVRAWRRRFWFDTDKGVEFIHSIDSW